MTASDPWPTQMFSGVTPFASASAFLRSKKLVSG